MRLSATEQAIDSQKIWVLDNYICRGCNGRRINEATGHPFDRDWPHHIKYRSAGGDDSPANKIGLCKGCHPCCHLGTKDDDGNRITGDQFTLNILDPLEGTDDYRWSISHEWIRRRVARHD